MSPNVIRVVGARVHNLKNITVEIPRDKLVIITGLSGSGKSSLAFDTIFAEGQRRYVKSLSAYARQFLGQMNKPDVDYIDGLSPAVSIDQKGTSHNPRSTVGTVTEIYDYLRLLYARAGIPHCPICGREVVKQSAQEIVDAIELLPDASRILILAPVVRGRKGTYQAVFEEIRKSGFVRARVDGTVYSLDDEINLDRYKQHNIDAVVDRLVISHDGTDEDKKAARSRLTDSIETALKFGEGFLIVSKVDGKDNDLHFSENLSCPVHGISIPEIEPRTFSFNTPHGACPDCQGLGNKLEIDPDLLIPDRDISFNEGAIVAMEWGGPKEEGGYYWQSLEAAARFFDIDFDKAVKDLSKEQLEIILYGTRGKEIPIKYKSAKGHEFTFARDFEGVVGNLERRYRETNSEYIRERISEYMSDKPCPTCKGQRLRPEAIAVTVGGVNIIEVTAWPVNQNIGLDQRDQRQEIAADQSPKSDCRTRNQGNQIASRLSRGRWIGLFDFESFGWFTFRRRSATHSTRNASRFTLGRCVVCSRRTIHWITCAR